MVLYYKIIKEYKNKINRDCIIFKYWFDKKEKLKGSISIAINHNPYNDLMIYLQQLSNGEKIIEKKIDSD